MNTTIIAKPIEDDDSVGNSLWKDAYHRLLKNKLALQKDEFLPGASYIAKWGYKVDASGTAPYAP